MERRTTPSWRTGAVRTPDDGPLPQPPAAGAATAARPWHERLRRSTTVKLGAFGLTTAVAIGQCAPAPACTPPPPAGCLTAAGTTISGPIQAVVGLTNDQRSANGLAPLALDQALVNAAQAHAAYQASTNTMSHAGCNGTDAGARIGAQGYAWSRWGENVAMGYPDPPSVMGGWMGSSGHRQNILNGNYTEIGVGVAYAADGTPYWTQVLAARG